MAKAPVDIRSLARSHTVQAIQTLAGIMRDGTSEMARLAAANSLLDRGWGKPKETVEVIKSVREIPDYELNAILAGSDRSGEGIAVSPNGAGKPN